MFQHLLPADRLHLPATQKRLIAYSHFPQGAISLVNTLILVASIQAAPFRWLVQSAVHALILPTLALVVFYCGYRGVAEPDTKLVSRFKVRFWRSR